MLCLNTVHNFPRPRAIKVMQEIQRVSGGHAFVQVDSYHTPEQKEIFESWVLTAEFYDYPAKWVELFREAGYTGRLLLDNHRMKRQGTRKVIKWPERLMQFSAAAAASAFTPHFICSTTRNPKKVIGIGRAAAPAGTILAQYRQARGLRISRAPCHL